MKKIGILLIFVLCFNIFFSFFTQPNISAIGQHAIEDGTTYGDVETDEYPLSLAGADDVYAVAFSNNNDYVALGDIDGEVRVYSTSDWTLTHTFTNGSGIVESVDFSYDNKYIAYGSRDDNCYVHNLGGDWSLVATLNNNSGDVKDVVFSHNNSQIACGNYFYNGAVSPYHFGEVIVYRTSDWSQVVNISEGQGVECVDYSVDGAFLAYGTWDDNCYIYNTSTWTKTTTLSPGSTTVGSVAFSEDNNYFALMQSGSNSGCYVYYQGNWTYITELVPDDDLDAHNHVDFSFDNNRIAYAGRVDGPSEYYIYIHDIGGSWSQNWSVDVSTSDYDSVYDIDFSNNGEWLAYGCRDTYGYVEFVGYTYFDVTRTTSTLNENNSFSFSSPFNYTDNVNLVVPVSNAVSSIDNVTNNTCGGLATSVTSLALLENNTYYYDSENQFVYIRTVNITYGTTVDWTVNCTYGTFAINVYNENTSNEIGCWDLYISNSAGTQTYESLCNNNTFYVSVEDLPYGDDTLIKINADNYSFRIYYMDLEVDTEYTLNAYLPDINETESYLLRVINEYQNPIVDAKVQVQRYINDTLGYEDVSIMLTDGNGYCPAIWLIPNQDYAARITASDYDTDRFDFFPISIVYVEDRYFTFQLSPTAEEYQNETMFDEIITFEGYIDGTTLMINYTDTLSETIDTTVTIWEFNTSNTTNPVLFCTQDVRIGDDDFQITETINSGNTYEITLDLNHTTFGYQHLVFIVSSRATITTRSIFDALFDANFQYNPFGWSNTFGLFILIATLFSFGQRNSGVGLMLGGFILLGVNSVIGLAVITVTIPLIFVCLGILVQWNNQRREYG